MVNRYGELLPITYRMCVTRYKEKVGKYTPMGVYKRVHYYKRNCGMRDCRDRNARIMK